MWGALARVLVGVLAGSIGSLVGRALLALGIGFVTYKGADVGVTALYSYVKASFAGAPASVVQLLAYLWVDKAISLMFSAFTAALAIRTAASGLTRIVAGRK